MSVLDRIRSAAGNQGWWLGELQGDSGRPAAPVSAADVRLWGWASYSRGARAISYTGWTPTWMTARDGTFTDRAKAAGELAGNLSRNVRLFAPMRPQPARVAVLDTTDAGAAIPGSSARSHESMLVFHSLMFERNVQTDFLRQEALIAGAGSRYSVIYVDPSAALSQPVEQALKAYAGAGGTLIRENLTKTSGIPASVERSIASARITPEIRITGAPGLVEARFLESAEAWLLVAINHADTPQTVTLAFAPDVPEAIWQNMETGAAVHFVQGPEGPTYRHQFAARDVMLLVRGKRLR
jgi:hypothetical protein